MEFRLRALSLVPALSLCLSFGLAGLPLAAQDVPVQLTGRMDSSFTWVNDPLPDGGQSLGMVTGWVGLTGGTKDVKAELRTSFTNVPALSLGLNRAWLKFRFPGVRFTSGLGRLAWGPGFVLVPGDLLFGSVGTELDFGADELRAQGAWLGDAWISLGDEAFAEAAVLKDSAGLRVSAAPAGVTIEASGAWDRPTKTAKAALSTQFHAGVDWYATLRQDLSLETRALSPDQIQLGAGAFGLWTLGDGINLSTRHEVWAPGTELTSLFRTYHDLGLAFDGGVSVTGRLLSDRARNDWSPSAEARWAVLQNLNLWVTGPLKAPWACRIGATAQW